MKIAVIGAGFSGLALAWELSNRHSVTLFDSNPIGQSTSGLSAGLLHPFTGVHAKLAKDGWEGFFATFELLKVAEKSLGYSPYEATGILRSALLPGQEESFKACANHYPQEVQWLEANESAHFIPGIANVPGIFIKKGMTIYSHEYLQGLWLACQDREVSLCQQNIHSLKELKDYDKIVIAAGAGCSTLKELSEVPLYYTKGQILEMEWPQSLLPLPFAINSHIYCVMLPNKESCLVGSTYEKQFFSPLPDLEKAKKELLPKLEVLYPPLLKAHILRCKAGIRVSTPQRSPTLKKIGVNAYLLTGMGSKGLLYHALYAKRLSQML